MINTDENALICDLAETYGIFDYKSFPCKMVAAFSCGLRDNSRIKMKLADTQMTTEEMLLAAIADHLAVLVWFESKDGVKGINRPKSILQALMKRTEEKENVSFSTPEEFCKEWNRITGGEGV